MKSLKPLWYGSCLIVFGLCLTQSAFYFWMGKKAEAEGNTWTAHHAKEAERFKAMQSHIELESKRTTVQMEIRRMVIAEYRKCRKGKC